MYQQSKKTKYATTKSIELNQSNYYRNKSRNESNNVMLILNHLKEFESNGPKESSSFHTGLRFSAIVRVLSILLIHLLLSLLTSTSTSAKGSELVPIQCLSLLQSL